MSNPKPANFITEDSAYSLPQNNVKNIELFESGVKNPSNNLNNLLIDESIFQGGFQTAPTNNKIPLNSPPISTDYIFGENISAKPSSQTSFSLEHLTFSNTAPGFTKIHSGSHSNTPSGFSQNYPGINNSIPSSLSQNTSGLSNHTPQNSSYNPGFGSKSVSSLNEIPFNLFNVPTPQSNASTNIYNPTRIEPQQSKTQSKIYSNIEYGNGATIDQLKTYGKSGFSDFQAAPQTKEPVDLESKLFNLDDLSAGQPKSKEIIKSRW